MTETRATLLALCLLTVGVAGCMGDGGGSGDAAEPASEDPLAEQNETETNETPEDLGPTITTTWFNGSVQGQSLPTLGPFCVSSCDNSMTFEVPNGTTGVLVEVAWEAEASIMLDVDVPSDACEAGSGQDCPPEQTSGSGGHLEVRLTQESQTPAGNWSASVWTEDSPSQPVEFTVAASSVQDGAMPSQFAKLGQGQGQGA